MAAVRVIYVKYVGKKNEMNIHTFRGPFMLLRDAIVVVAARSVCNNNS